MSYFIRNGNTYKVADDAAIDIQRKLPVGNYTVKITPQGEFYLEMIDTFNRPKKLYGDTSMFTRRILDTFQDRHNSTGVMLNGEKGSGKTLLAKNLSIEAAALADIPTIVINSPMRGDGFNTLIQNIDQECIILFDEFEKVYDKDEQEEVLTLLDGVYPSKKLFILTCNDKYRVDQHMRNRPGRIYYMLDFKGLEANFIREYCEDNLTNKEYNDSIVNISTIFDAFNFDMLKALVEEMNRYNESPQEALRMLNVKQEFDEGGNFDVKLELAGVEVNHNRDDGWKGNPLRPRGFDIYWEEFPDDEDTDWTETTFTPGDLVNIKAEEGVFVFTNKRGLTVTFTRKKAQSFNYYSF